MAGFRRPDTRAPPVRQRPRRRSGRNRVRGLGEVGDDFQAEPLKPGCRSGCMQGAQALLCGAFALNRRARAIGELLGLALHLRSLVALHSLVGLQRRLGRLCRRRRSPPLVGPRPFPSCGLARPFDLAQFREGCPH